MTLPGLQIRDFRPTDALEIMRLFHDTVHNVNSRDYTPEQVEAWAPALMDEPRWQERLRANFTYVAEANALGLTGDDAANYVKGQASYWAGITSLVQNLGAFFGIFAFSWITATRGDHATAQRLAARVLNNSRRHRMSAAQATWALGLTDFMAGDPHGAITRLERVCDGPPGRDFTVRAMLNTPPKPVSMSTMSGRGQALVMRSTSISTSCRVLMARSGSPREAFATPPPDR